MACYDRLVLDVFKTWLSSFLRIQYHYLIPVIHNMLNIYNNYFLVCLKWYCKKKNKQGKILIFKVVNDEKPSSQRRVERDAASLSFGIAESLWKFRMIRHKEIWNKERFT